MHTSDSKPTKDKDRAPGRATAAGRGGKAMVETARLGMQAAAQEMEETERSLADAVEEDTAGMRSLLGAPGFNPSGLQDAQQAVSKLVQGLMQTNMRFADELLRRRGPSTVVDLQRQFLREYFDALAQGGTMLLRAARQHGGGEAADVVVKDVEFASSGDTAQQASWVEGASEASTMGVERIVEMWDAADVDGRLDALLARLADTEARLDRGLARTDAEGG